MATTTNTIEVKIAAGRAMALSANGKAVVDIVSGPLGAGYTSLRLNQQIGEKVLGPYSVECVIRIRPNAGVTVTYNDKLQQVSVFAEVDPVTGVADGILTTNSARQFASVPLIVTGGDQVGDQQTATFVNGSGAVQWFRQDPGTLAITDISGQTGSTYTRAVADVGLIVSAYASSWKPTAAGRLTRAGVPTAPQNVAATAGNQQATITWTAPASTNGGALLNPAYLITRLPGGQQFQTNALTYTDTGLTNGVVYTYYVQAVNASGPSQAAASNSVTPAQSMLLPLNSLWTVDGDSMSTTGGSSVPSWVGRAIEKTKGRFKIPVGGVLSVAGNTLDQIITRQATVAALGAAVHSLGSITNQFLDTTDTGAQILAKVQAYATYLFTSNANLKFFTVAKVPERVDTSWTSNGAVATKEANRVAYNAGLSDWAATDPRIKVIEYTGWVPAIAPDVATLGTTDGLHQNFKQADEVMGDAAAAVLNSLIVQGSINTGLTNLLVNPAFTSTTAVVESGFTGTKPASWTLSITSGLTAVASVVDTTDEDGNACKGVQFVVTGTAASLSNLNVTQSINVSAFNTVDGVNGLEGWCDFKIGAGSAFTGAVYTLVGNVGSSVNRNCSRAIAPVAKTGRVRALPFVFGSVVTNSSQSFGVQFQPGAVACTFTLIAPAVKRIGT